MSFLRTTTMEENHALMEKEKPYLKEHEVADYLGLSVSTLRNWRYTGTNLRFHRFGGAVRYSISVGRSHSAAGGGAIVRHLM